MQLVKLPPNSKVAVIGAGISGLSFSYFLSKLRPDLKIKIYESKNRCGGWINSARTKLNTNSNKTGGEILLEKGPRTLRGVSDGTVLIIDILQKLGLENEIKCIESNSEANKKYILDVNKKLCQVPPTGLKSFLHFITNPMSKGLLTGILGEPFRSPSKVQDETAYDFLKRRFGNTYIADNLFSAIFHGIYAGDIKQLSVNCTLNKLAQMEKDYGSILRAVYHKRNAKPEKSLVLSQYNEKFCGNSAEIDEISQLNTFLSKYPALGLKNGLSTLPNSLESYILKNPNVEIQYGKHIENFKLLNHDKTNAQKKAAVELDGGKELFDHIHITVPTAKLFSKCENIDKDFILKLEKLKSASVILVNYYLPNKDVIFRNHGFGYLVPQSVTNHESLLGVIFDSCIEQSFQPLFGARSEIPSPNPPYTKLTAMLGANHSFVDSLSTAAVDNAGVPSPSLVKGIVKECFKEHLGIDEKDLENGHWEVTLASNAIPQYYVGYNHTDLESKLPLNVVTVGGMKFSKGPGVPDVVVKSFETALGLA
ncbi:related to Protoporphyrinogen oxidase [Saccharomycodes ludwigii]|uniref:Protoporphyrinogen oxidase n=1 Tax=Saccharomycodes ludwigii TaxID=36035 RepID=A0A376B7W3_9ASCO|nr:hypothetical protein SCDLUD_005196 [Saccharomycodes ludwigii]KAH3898857.1 hypothetical protein SCDLUD_005196 [Saccharomycodes ludwigii]SSD60594.1 related to Protoporphyrinogen oxidase [Saccharomycodes ludwigii]